MKMIDGVVVQECDPPADGATKKDQANSAWVACCGIWYSKDAWAPPQLDIERDPEDAVRTHRVLSAETENCPECGRSLRRHEPDAVDAARVLAIAEIVGESGREAAYAQRLRDTSEGKWLRFGPVTIAPRASQRIPVFIVEPVENVAFLSLPADVARRVRVLDVMVGREALLDEGPIPGECFAVRIPVDARHPIDRGGSLRRRATAFAGIPVFVVLENVSAAPIEAIGALFAPTAPKLSVASSKGVGSFGSGGG